MFKTIAVTTAITLSAVSVQAKDYLDGVYTGGLGPSNSIAKRMSKKPHSAWVWEETGCGNNCPQPNAPKNGIAGYSFKLLTIWHNPVEDIAVLGALLLFGSLSLAVIVLIY